jgi:hypothetical protein
MSASRRYKTPQHHGEVLADPSPEAAAKLVGPNREIRRKLLPEDLFTSARQNVLDAAVSYLRETGEPVPPLNDGPLIVTGHQPELFHPGVWAKNFAANGLARRVGGLSLNLIADSDTLKDRTIRVPVLKGNTARVEIVPFDSPVRELPFELASIVDPEKLVMVGDRLIAILAKSWPFNPMPLDCLNAFMCNLGKLIGEYFSRLRRDQERDWGCHNLELPVSRLCQTNAWAEFVAAIERRLAEFTQVYNAAIVEYRQANRVRSVNHPAPLLEPGERPFWRMTATGRDRPYAVCPPGELRPRALTLTLFARLFFADLFIHGIGGGKYDEVTDAIIRGFFHCEPPAYQVLTLTAHLPFVVEGDPEAELQAAKRRLRDMQWNPQRYEFEETSPIADALRRTIQANIAQTPVTHAARLQRYHWLRDYKTELADWVVLPQREAEESLRHAATRSQTAAVLQRRDYAWVLFPEATLRPLMTQFL